MDENPDRELDIFNEARRLPPAQRSAFLDQACGADAVFHQRIVDLLRAGEDAVAFMENPQGPGGTIRMHAVVGESAGDCIGRYKLLQQIGEGGCGVVYMAEQTEPVRRKVALKVIKLGMDSREVIARFEAERQALALMDHPNIAKVLDAGTTEAGRPYFVMELVRGIKVTEYCDQNNLPTRERLDLFIQICRAVQHAHQKGIIHRDLKPSNILVTMNDGVPLPKVIDFGIAKATHGRLTDKTLFTAFEQFIGTPAYMSPEQAEMSALDIDTRSDIYSLGVLLYELLTGRTPFDARELLQSGLDEMRRTIREKEPARPSTTLTRMGHGNLHTVAQQRGVDPPKLVHLLSGDLDWIVMKTLEKDRARRYETVSALAADIRRHLDNEPVLAGPPNQLYRFKKTLARNKVAWTAAAVIVLSLLLGIAGTTAGFLRSEKERRIAQSRELEAREQAYASDIGAAFRALADGDFGLVRKILTGLAPSPGQVDLRSFEWRYLWGRSRGDQSKVLSGHSGHVDCVAYNPKGTLVASGSSDHTVRLWDVKRGDLVCTCGNYSGDVSCVAFSPDGRLLASGDGKCLRLWDIAAGQFVATVTNKATWISFSSNLMAVATGGGFSRGWGGQVELWDFQKIQKVRTLPVSGNFAVFSPNGEFLACDSWPDTLKIWNVVTDEAVRTVHCENIYSLAFSKGGNELIWSADKKFLWTWDFESGQPILLAGPSGNGQHDVGISPDGDTLAVGMPYGDIALWSLSERKIVHTLLGHKEEAWPVAFSPDGHFLVSGAWDKTVRIWDLQSRIPENVISNTIIPAWHIAGYPVFSPDGKTLASASTNGDIRLWDVASGQYKATINAPSNLPVMFLPNGKGLLTVDNLLPNHSVFKKIQTWDLPTGALLSETPLAEVPDYSDANAFSYDRQLFATAHWSRVILRNSVSGLIQTEFKTSANTRSLAFSPSGRLLATGHWDGTAELWDVATGKSVLQIRGFDGGTGCFSFSPDEKLLAVGGWDHTIRVWNLEGKELHTTLIGHKGAVKGLAFSNDAKTLASGADDFTVRLWNVATGREIAHFPTESAHRFLSFSSDDRTLATGGGGGGVTNGYIHFWRAPTFEEIAREEP